MDILNKRMESIMNAARLLSAGFASAFAIGISTPSYAVINGYFDAVDVGSIDNMYGWICDSTNPNTAPPGKLSVYVGGPAGGGGTFYSDFTVAYNWGGYRPDVPDAGFCGSNDYTGFQLPAYLSYPVYLYYKFPNGTLQLLGGSPKTCSGPGWCY